MDAGTTLAENRRADAHSAAEVADTLGEWGVGAGMVTLALFPLAIPFVALTAVALLPLLAPVLVLGVVAGLLPIPALLMLLSLPLAVQVDRGLRPNYDNPYGLMAVMAVNIKLHLYAGLLLVAGYLLVLVAQAVAPGVPLFVGA